MNISTLEQYVEQKNKWAAIFKGKQMEWQTPQGRQRIADSLDADLSPENITCDGERPRSEVQRLYKFYSRAALELKSIDPSVTFYEFG